jgi:hypothetical protein
VNILLQLAKIIAPRQFAAGAKTSLGTRCMYMHSTSTPDGTAISVMAGQGTASVKMLPAVDPLGRTCQLIAIIQINEGGALLPIHVMRYGLPSRHPNTPRYCQLHIDVDAITIYIPHDSIFAVGQTDHHTPPLATLCWSDPHTNAEDFHVSVAELIFTGEEVAL